MNIVLQDEGIHDSVHPQQQEKEGDEKVSKDEIERRKEIMKKIKNRIVDDFWTNKHNFILYFILLFCIIL